MGRTNIKPTISYNNRARKLYMSDDLEYVDMMRITPAKYIYDRYHDIGHSYRKKPYADYADESYPMMEYTWQQDPIDFDWTPDWDWTLPDYDITLPDVTTSYQYYSITNWYVFSVRNAGNIVDWSTIRNAGTGSAWSESFTDEGLLCYAYLDGDLLTIGRTFVIFDLSGVTGPIEAAYINVRSNQIGNAGVICAYVAHNTIWNPGSTNDYDAFTIYDPVTGENISPWGIKTVVGSGEHRIQLDGRGIDYLNSVKGANSYFVLRDYTYDDRNVAPTPGNDSYVTFAPGQATSAIRLYIGGTGLYVPANG